MAECENCDEELRRYREGAAADFKVERRLRLEAALLQDQLLENEARISGYEFRWSQMREELAAKDRRIAELEERDKTWHPLQDDLLARIAELEEMLLTSQANERSSSAQLEDVARGGNRKFRPNIEDCMDPWVCCIHDERELDLD